MIPSSLKLLLTHGSWSDGDASLFSRSCVRQEFFCPSPLHRSWQGFCGLSRHIDFQIRQDLVLISEQYCPCPVSLAVPNMERPRYKRHSSGMPPHWVTLRKVRKAQLITSFQCALDAMSNESTRTWTKGLQPPSASYMLVTCDVVSLDVQCQGFKSTLSR